MQRQDPISNIQWLKASDLDGNDWNPNMVMDPELKLLERSLLKTGWVQPVLISRDKVIIDGFHRWRLSMDSPAIRARWGGLVPCAVLDVDRAQAMVMTIRMNRAKGSHSAVRMSAIVRELLEKHGLEPEQVAAEIGACAEEVELLRQDDLLIARGIDKYRYSKAWIPKETGKPSEKKAKA